VEKSEIFPQVLSILLWSFPHFPLAYYYNFLS